MLKPLLISACLAGSLGLGLGGCATHLAAPAARTAANAPREADCIRDTGSRIPSPDHPCRNVPGSTYSQQELEMTGQTNPGAALRQLSPSVH